MQTLDTLTAILRDVTYKTWKFTVTAAVDGFRLQVHFIDAEGAKMSGRKWLVSAHATKSEVVQTALKAVLTAEEHEAREQFYYRGSAIFGPHLDVDTLVRVADELDVREAAA